MLRIIYIYLLSNMECFAYLYLLFNMVMRNYVSRKWKQFLIVIKVVGRERLPTTIGPATQGRSADSLKSTYTAICSYL
jgi:hypothetical protein